MTRLQVKCPSVSHLTTNCWLAAHASLCVCMFKTYGWVKRRENNMAMAWLRTQLLEIRFHSDILTRRNKAHCQQWVTGRVRRVTSPKILPLWTRESLWARQGKVKTVSVCFHCTTCVPVFVVFFIYTLVIWLAMFIFKRSWKVRWLVPTDLTSQSASSSHSNLLRPHTLIPYQGNMPSRVGRIHVFAEAITRSMERPWEASVVAVEYKRVQVNFCHLFSSTGKSKYHQSRGLYQRQWWLMSHQSEQPCFPNLPTPTFSLFPSEPTRN